jgi:hypothetical protein
MHNGFRSLPYETRMDWEIVNGVTGLISAVCAVLSIVYLSLQTTPERGSEAARQGVISSYKLASFVIACSGWALCCLSFLWVVEPYGSYPSREDYQHFYGIIIAFPAIVILMFGLGLLQEQERDK